MSDGIVSAISISLFGTGSMCVGEERKRQHGSMETGYSMLTGDLDVCRMFDQYTYKRSDNLDLSLSVPQHHQNTYHHDGGYNMADQTFHTPSFGDEDFDIPAIHPHQQHQQHHQQQQQHDPMRGYQSQMMQGGGMQQSPDALSLDPGGYQQPLYLQQEHTMQPINVSSAYTSPQASYTSMSSPGHQHSGQQLLLLQQQHNQAQQQQHAQHQQQVQMHMQYVHTQHQQMQNQHQQQQMQYRSPPGGSPPAIQQNPPAENNNTTTSEDSDDSTPHSAMITGMKRPSPEPVDTVNKAQKKPKAQKKKKKRDPNEPQKPVSAYALFFRDTQAAIKGQNPNASFGEVSKIVASMWDALETEHKNVYKKKTEAAKKEYLKALAAYRASVVSKSAGDEPQPQQPPPPQQQPQQQQQQQQPQVQYGYGYGGNQAGNVAYQVYSPQPQPPSPQQQAHQHQQMAIKKSPHHLTGMQPNHPQQQGMMGNPMAPPHMTQQQHMQQQVSQQQYMQQVPQQQVQQVQIQQQQIMHMSPPRADSLSSPPPVTGQQTGLGQSPPSNSCIRQGCPNPAIANSEWEDEYCSNECVVSHCRDVFTTWVSSNQNPQQNFSTVK
ncbi:TOX high mobility group box family member 3-like isoform X2 [Diachasmimorpha longicaudata]|uniref:TOX high mobility group box family member 3-like isoform X2 n=1 Tax=Diachasmimorpha longicaudata TaxID=58733 RepID=UPI0030B88B14